MQHTDLKIVEPDIFTSGFCEYLSDLIGELLKKKDTLHIALSGGNTPKKIFNYLAEHYKNTIPWNKLHFYWGDERCVPSDSEESNYGVAKSMLFDRVSIPHENIHAVNGENTPEKEADKYAGVLLKHTHTRNGLPSLDINILGMGDDGHTASIFPHQMELLQSDKICEVATHPVSGQKRITITGKTLNNSQITLFLISGATKSEILKQIIKHENEAEKYPASHVKPDWGRLVFYVDTLAASTLNDL